MVDFQALEVNHKGVIYFLHAAFVVTVSILLMNMIIAVFSNTVAHISSHRPMLFTIQRLTVSWVLEARMMRVSPALVKRLCQNYFICDNGKIYVHEVRVNCQSERI